MALDSDSGAEAFTVFDLCLCKKIVSWLQILQKFAKLKNTSDLHNAQRLLENVNVKSPTVLSKKL